MTTCVHLSQLNVKSFETIPFKQIKAVHGTTDDGGLKREGILTCKRKGLYQVSAFVQTSSDVASITILKNGEEVADSFSTRTSAVGYDTVVVNIVVDLQDRDTIIVTPRRDMVVFGGFESCLSKVQVH